MASVKNPMEYNGFELEWVREAAQESSTEGPSSRDSSLTPNRPIDLDEFFADFEAQGMDQEDAVLFMDDVEMFPPPEAEARTKYFDNPNKRLLDDDASMIPGSPFSVPANRHSTRPKEPLSLAKYASSAAFLVTIAWVGALIFFAIWNYSSAGRIIFEVLLALLSFFGLFWNSYFIVSSILKCFIPAKAFRSNTKYCSIIPENKPELEGWCDVTIQIAVYKESLHEVLRPTMKSCIKARDYYEKHSKASCNIVVCDDGMMAMLHDRFPTAEMLWKTIVETQGQVLKLSKLLKHVPRESRRHLKGLHSKNVYEVFHRMLFYYHYKIGFVARSTVDRKGNCKKASNLNAHLRLSLGAAQLKETQGDMSFEEALREYSHNPDGSCYIMYGNDVQVGQLICVNNADALMAESVVLKTVPEFLKDHSLGFTQHPVKSRRDQRGESYFVNLLGAYYDALYQGHYTLSSILGCQPPLVGHSFFLRTNAIKNCGRVRTLQKAQRWLHNIGLPFLPVDQIGFGNLQADSKIEYWSEDHTSADFELMIHLYNLGFNGRYCVYPNCEFEKTVRRTFDEEASQHRKAVIGSHELLFNPLQDILGHGILTPLFKTFMASDIPSYYKIFLTAYLCSFTLGGTYIIVFVAEAIARLLEHHAAETLYGFSPVTAIVLNFVLFYIVGQTAFLLSLSRMYLNNKKLLFREYRKKCGGICKLLIVTVGDCLFFQFPFYTVMTNFQFLGSMDHMMSRPCLESTTNKKSRTSSRCVAFFDMAEFNFGSWVLALIVGGLAYLTVLQDFDWDITRQPNYEEWIQISLFSAPAGVLAAFSFVVPIILNPYILGWPFLPKKKKPKKREPETISFRPKRQVVGLNTFMDTTKELDNVIDQAPRKQNIEIGSIYTTDLKSHASREFNPEKIENLRSLLQSKEAEARAHSRGRAEHAERAREASRGRAERVDTMLGTPDWDNQGYTHKSRNHHGRRPRHAAQR